MVLGTRDAAGKLNCKSFKMEELVGICCLKGVGDGTKKHRFIPLDDSNEVCYMLVPFQCHSDLCSGIDFTQSDSDVRSSVHSPTRGRIFFSARKFHQFDSSNNEYCGLRLMVRVEVLGSVNPIPNPNPLNVYT